MRPQLPRFLLHATVIGLFLGTVEVAVRVSPLQGLGPADLATFLVSSAAAAVAASVSAALVAWCIGRRAHGVHAGLLLGYYAAINYRFEVVLNEFVRDPRVWGGVLGMLAAGGMLGLLADNRLRSARWITQGCAVFSAIACVAALIGSKPTDGAVGTLPSVVIISLDTTRMDRLSPYGHDIATPHLARIAKEGVTFDQAIAEAPITEPSHLAMLTGIPPYASGVVSNGTSLGDRPALISRALHDRGYLTAGFVAGFPLHSKYGWSQGMDVYDDDFGTPAGWQTLSLVKGYNQVAIREHAIRERTSEQVLARALPWLERHRSEQFFAFIHFYDVHGPYQAPGNVDLAPPPRDGAPLSLPPYWPAPDRAITSADWLQLAYDKEVEHVDEGIGRILNALGSALDQTIVIVTADHGESFTEHGYLFDHGDNLYDPSLRVPLLIRYPPVARPGIRVACQVGGIDIAATVLALTGTEDGVPRQGRSRVGELQGGECTATPVVSLTTAGRFVEVPPVAHSLRTEVEKIIVSDDKPVELFDLRDDPGERQNLAPSGRSRDAESAVRALLATGTGAQGAVMDRETCEALKALGYLDGETECGG